MVKQLTTPLFIWPDIFCFVGGLIINPFQKSAHLKLVTNSDIKIKSFSSPAGSLMLGKNYFKKVFKVNIYYKGGKKIDLLAFVLNGIKEVGFVFIKQKR